MSGVRVQSEKENQREGGRERRRAPLAACDLVARAGEPPAAGRGLPRASPASQRRRVLEETHPRGDASRTSRAARGAPGLLLAGAVGPQGPASGPAKTPRARLACDAASLIHHCVSFLRFNEFSP